MRFLLTIVVVFAVLVLGASTAAAQPINGDFESGGTGWTTSQTNPAWFLSFEPSDGNPNGYARIMSSFGGSVGIGCVTQTFDCPAGSGNDCLICLDYRHSTIDSEPEVGFVVLKMDGAEIYRTPPEDFSGWTSIGILVPAGTHELSMCLDVLMGFSNNNGWEAGFDNVVVNQTCDGIIPTEHPSWGTIKALYD